MILAPPDEPEAVEAPGAGKHRRLRLTILLILLALSLALFVGKNYRRWTERSVPSRGGEFFKEALLLPVPLYRQWDPAWGADRMGESEMKLAGGGCCVSCAAMALTLIGVPTTPGELNTYLSMNGGYARGGLIRWQKAADFTKGRVRLSYVGPPDHALIDRKLRAGVPSIVKVYLPSDESHWVLIVGKRGEDYLAHDPLDTGPSPVPLSKCGKAIYGLRIYEPVQVSGSVDGGRRED